MKFQHGDRPTISSATEMDMKFSITVTLLLALSFAIRMTPAQAADDGWGNLAGSIVVEGDLPEIPEEVIDKDKATCLVGGQAPKDDNLIVGKNGGLRDVIVMMYFQKDDPKPAVHPSYETAKAEPVEIDNKNCRFVPHAVFVRTGQTFKLKNTDDVGHNCHITCFNNEENINLAPGGVVEVKLNNAEKTPGNIVCDVHKWMDAVVLIRDEPYVAITDDDGKFHIDNLPAGTWNFQFWHKKAGYLRQLEVPGHKVGRKGEIEVTIKPDETLDLGKLVFPAKSFKN